MYLQIIYFIYLYNENFDQSFGLVDRLFAIGAGDRRSNLGGGITKNFKMVLDAFLLNT